MKLVVVGAGSIGRRHIRNLRSLGSGDIAVFDPDPSSREWVSREYGIPTLETYEAALAWDPEAALICSPSHLHLRQAREFLSLGAHLFIEKPLAERWEGVPEFIEAAKASGKVVQVGFNMRFHPAVRLIRESLVAGVVGTPWVLRTRFGHYLPQWRPDQDYRDSYSAHAVQGGGVLMDCIHEIDYMLLWGEEVQEVSSLLAHASDLEIDTEDYATILMRFASGAVGEVRLDYLRFEKLREAEVIGSQGMILWESRGKAPEHVVVRRLDRGSQAYLTLHEAPNYDINETYVSEMNHFLSCIRGEEETLVSVAEAANSLAVVLKARESFGAALSTHGSAAQ